MITCLYERTSPSSLPLARAYALGHGGTVVGYRPGMTLPEGPIFMFGSRILWPLLQAAVAMGTEYYYADHGYFARGKYYRITKNALQGSGCDGTEDLARLSAMGVTIKPWRKAGDHVLLCPPDDAFAGLFGFKGADWAAMMEAILRQYTGREIRIRERRSTASLQRDLEGCHALVTWTSNVAVDAVLAGVPVFCTGPCAARYMGLADLSEIERPRVGQDRLPWAARLASQQWTLREIRSGTR